MKRASALTDLSKEHHTALVISKKLKKAISDTECSTPKKFWDENRLKYADELLPHFTEEERRFGHLLEPPLKDEFEDDHSYFRDTLKQTSKQLSTEQIIEFAERLIKHVRFEERTLFKWLEDHHPDDISTQ